jgi:PAS domain S-box-containing protein
MSKPHRTVLVIGNSYNSGGEYRHQLQQDATFSYRVITERYDNQILALCRSQQIDGILLELHSPHSGSLNFLGQLKQQMGKYCPPIVVIDSGDAEMAVRAFKNGAADYLIRDRMTPDDLCLAMRSAIENADLRRELQRSQEQFQTSVENMLDCFGIFSSIRDESGQIVDFRIDYLNRAACENNRMPKEMQMGRGLCEVLPAHRESGLFDEYCRLVETGEPLIKDSLVYEDIYGEQRLTRAFDIRATKLNDGFVASWRDITDRKRLELELSQTATDLRQQRNRLQRLIDTAPIGIGIGSASGEVRVINDAMLHLHGYTREEFEQQGMNWHDFTPPEWSERTQQAMEQLRQQGFLPPEKKDLLCRDGSRIPIWISATQWMDGTDEHVAFAVDLTQLKQAEATLKASQQRYRDLAEAMPQMVWTADATGAVNYWNQRWYEYTGLSEAESMGLSGVSTVHPDERDRTLEQWSQSVANGEPFEIQYRIRRWDGVYHWFISRGIPTRDNQGQITGWIGTITDIDHQKQLEQRLLNEIANHEQSEVSLRESEERLQMALDGSGGGLWDWNIITNEDYLSPRWLEMLGYEEGELLGNFNTWEQLIHPDDKVWVMERLNSHLQDNSVPYKFEYRMLTKSGEWKWIANYGKVVMQDDQGNPLRMAGIHQDVSDRKQAEKALAANEVRLQGFVDANVVGILYGDIYGNIHEANDELLRIIGYPREDLRAGRLRWIDITPPEHLPLDEQAIAEAQTNGACTPYEKEYIRKDGSRVPVLIGYSLVGEAREESVAFILDLSDRKQAEEALRQSEERYRYLAEAIPQLVWTCDASGLCDYVNQRLCDYTGLTVEQAVGMGWLSAVHPEDFQATQAVWMSAVHDGSCYRNEYRFRRASDSSYRWHLVLGLPLKNQQGRVVKWFGTCTDIHDQKELQIERDRLLQLERAAREAAERANRIKDEFLAILSHELRSPLNPILGWTRLLQTRKFDETKMAEAFATIERNAKLQTQLIDDLLDIAKILRGKLSLNTTSVNLASVIEAAIETIKTTAVAKSISLHSVLPNIGQVSGDAARLQQIVWNLLSNAIKFTPNGGRVDIWLKRVDNQAEITVKDTGKGISPDFLPHIFESFRQEDASITRKYGGLGLGLAIVRQLVEAHGGTITADSPGEGLGATFTVRLPLLNVEPEIKQTDELPQQELDLTGILVLAVDDNPDARELLTVLLSQYGAEVLTVASAAEVLATLESSQPDVLVSDIGMPEVDGYTLIQQIRTLPPEKGGQIPAIALTAYASEDDYQRALASGYQRHVTKPLEPERLVQAVVALVQIEPLL